MTNRPRTLMTYLTIALGTASGCAVEMSPGPEPAPVATEPVGGGGANEELAVGPALSPERAREIALAWYRRGQVLLGHARGDSEGMLEDAKTALLTCLKVDPQMGACFRLLVVANLPRPACGYVCGAAEGPLVLPAPSSPATLVAPVSQQTSSTTL